MDSHASASGAGVPTLRIFISSPSDVSEEREKAKHVISQLQNWYGDRVTLVPVLWEDLPLALDSSFQQGIDVILTTHPIDIAVFILWARLGSPIGHSVLDQRGKPFRSGTEREFELMLAAFEANAGRRPSILFYRRDDDGSFDRRLAGMRDAEKLEHFEQKLLAKSFVEEHFQDAEGHNTRAYHLFHQPVEFATRLKVHLQQLIDPCTEALEGQHQVRWTEAPYRGLEVFDLRHADIFFGREAEVCELETRLRQREAEGCAFVAVVGASGSGKSSLVRAGLSASLTRFNLDESIGQWRTALLLPAQTAGAPLAGLVKALAADPNALPELAGSGPPEAEIAEAFAESPGNTLRTVFKPAFARAANRVGGLVKLLLIIDQFEELFTDPRISPEDRDHLLLVLNAFARSGFCWVVVTLRSDFYPVAQKNELFLQLKGELGQLDLLAPSPEALMRIITEPARMAGIRFEKRPLELGGESLVSRILEDAKSQPDLLPLLSDLLLELYQLRTKENLITFAAYQSLGDEHRTGLEGALSKRADAEFAKLTPEQRSCCPEILHALVTVEADTDLRRRANLSALRNTPQKAALVDAFIQARLLTADGPTVSLAHEALLRKWPQISNWVRDNRQFLQIRSHVEQARKRWCDAGRRTDLLLPEGLELEEGVNLLQSAPHLLTGSEYDPLREYVLASLSFHEARGRKLHAVRRRVVFFLSLLAITATVGAIIGWIETREAREQRDAARFQEGLGWMLRAEVADAGGKRYPDELLYAAQAIGFDGVGRSPERGSMALLDRLQSGWDDFIGKEEKHIRYLHPDRNPEDYRKAKQWIANRPAFLPVWSSEAHPDAPVTAIAVDPTGKCLALGTKQSLRLLDLVAQTESLVPGVSGIADVDFDTAGKRLAIASAEGVRIWTGEKRALITLFPGKVTSLAWSPESEWLAGAGKEGAILLWEKGEGQPQRIESGSKKPASSLVFSPEDAFLAAVEPGAGPRIFFPDHRAAASSWLELERSKVEGMTELERDEFLGRVELAERATSVAVDPAGKLLVTGTEDGNVILWNAVKVIMRSQVSLEHRHTKRVNAVAFQPDGKRIASASEDQTVKLWGNNGSTLIVEATLSGHSRAVTAVTFSPSGQMLASAGADGKAMLWDVSGVKGGAPDLLTYLDQKWYSFHPDAQAHSGIGFTNFTPAALTEAWLGTEKPDLAAKAVIAAKDQHWRHVRLLKNLGVSLTQEIAEALARSSPPPNPKPGDTFTNGIGSNLLWCPPGTFTMGSSQAEMQKYNRTNEDRHQVTLSSGFWLGKYELTQAEWAAVMHRNPSSDKAERKPLEGVTWDDASEFCRRLTDLERSRGMLPQGWVYDLPTEAEWEYACRAGTRTTWSFGDDVSIFSKYGNFNDKSGDFNTERDLSQDDHFRYAAPVGRFEPNPWGFCDMHGNVWEWCRDRYTERLGTADDLNPLGAPSGTDRVYRGGCYFVPAIRCRSAHRGWGSPKDSTYAGFRLAAVPIRSPDGKESRIRVEWSGLSFVALSK